MESKIGQAHYLVSGRYPLANRTQSRSRLLALWQGYLTILSTPSRVKDVGVPDLETELTALATIHCCRTCSASSRYRPIIVLLLSINVGRMSYNATSDGRTYSCQNQY